MNSFWHCTLRLLLSLYSLIHLIWILTHWLQVVPRGPILFTFRHMQIFMSNHSLNSQYQWIDRLKRIKNDYGRAKGLHG